ncbi:MAG: FMN-binding negative transcriptional regulator [Proteobacteria bacterium]|nr:FMN-binding negative transcriptional regulator [Pseudomonadota bacterium]
MLQSSYFKQNDKQKLLAFIKEYPMASIVTGSSTGLIGNHIPMLVVEREGAFFLQGHVTKANSICKDCDVETDALAMFHGPNGYISPNWYPSKKNDPRTVPTWNYVAAHVSGKIKFYADKNWLKQHLKHLSDTHEKRVGESWKISDAPDDYIEKMLKAIVGVEIAIKKISGNTKMSQNHPQENRIGVIEGLTAVGKQDVAAWVEKPNRYE